MYLEFHERDDAHNRATKVCKSEGRDESLYKFARVRERGRSACVRGKGLDNIYSYM